MLTHYRRYHHVTNYSWKVFFFSQDTQLDVSPVLIIYLVKLATVHFFIVSNYLEFSTLYLFYLQILPIKLVFSRLLVNIPI